MVRLGRRTVLEFVMDTYISIENLWSLIGTSNALRRWLARLLDWARDGQNETHNWPAGAVVK
jgi:hypothetical protein